MSYEHFTCFCRAAKSVCSITIASLSFLALVILPLSEASVHNVPMFPGRRQGECNGNVGLQLPPDPSENLVGLCFHDAVDKQCSDLPAACFDCDFDVECNYGSVVETTCTVKSNLSSSSLNPRLTSPCQGSQTITRSVTCQYCFQTQEYTHHTCIDECTQCSSVSTPRERYLSNCTANSDVFCMGKRSFYKMKPCKFTTGYKWSTAFALSLTLGGFGADRFYLGYWREGLGKLFSFGGLGVWTIVDVVLIGVGFTTPSDGSLFI